MPSPPRRIPRSSPRAPLGRQGGTLRLLVAALLVAAVPGCGLFVAAGKMLWGDPAMPSPFTYATGTKLQKIEGKVLVYCSAPHAITDVLGSVELDLAEDAGREMKRKGVDVVPGSAVARYLQDSGGVWGDENELAREFPDAAYILHFDLARFDYKEENSPNLFRGRVNGMVYAFQVVDDGKGRRSARPVFQREFTSVYPDHAPIGVETMTARVFCSRLKNRIGRQLAQVFVDYRPSELLE